MLSNGSEKILICNVRIGVNTNGKEPTEQTGSEQAGSESAEPAGAAEQKPAEQGPEQEERPERGLIPRPASAGTYKGTYGQNKSFPAAKWLHLARSGSFDFFQFYLISLVRIFSFQIPLL